MHHPLRGYRANVATPEYGRTSGTTYRGRDRRAAPSPVTPATTAVALRDAATMLAVAGCACAVAVALHATVPTSTAALTLLLAGVAIASCAVVAEQSYVRWRLVGDAVAARLSVAFALYGTIVVPLAVTRDDGAGGAVGQLLGTAAASAALMSTLRCPDVVSRARLAVPAFVVGAFAAAATVVIGALPVAAQRLAALTVAGQPLLEVAGAAVVVVGSGAAMAAGLRLRRRSMTTVGAALALLVVAPAVATGGPTPPSGHLIAAAVQAAALALVVPVTVADTRLALRAVGRDNSTLRDRWRDVVEQIDGISQREAERTHELKSALLALEGASEVLRRHVERRGEPDDAALAAALASELARLRALVARLPTASRDSFSVRAALLPVVLAHRACGQTIILDIASDVEAAGRPEALAEAIGNLLTNAAVHAAGASVSISASVGQTVRVLVADDGPGIDPAALTARQRASGEGQPRHGLGLRLAARLVHDDGGRLAVVGRPHGTGAAIAIELPRSGGATPAIGESWTATAS